VSLIFVQFPFPNCDFCIYSKDVLPSVQLATLSISCQNPVFFLDKQQATFTMVHASISCSFSLLRGLEIMGIRSNELEKIELLTNSGSIFSAN
jgi:hypothetical protein